MKKSIIIIISVLGFTGAVLFIYYVITSVPTLSVSTKTIDSSDIEGQIEYINIGDKEVDFLTYRETALARYTNDGAFSTLSDQIFTGVIDNVWYWPDGKKVLIKFVNDPESLSDITGYKKTTNESVYATYNLTSKKLLILPAGPAECWLSSDTIVGLKGTELYQYRVSWEKADMNIQNENYIISSSGALIASVAEQSLRIYDVSQRKLTRTVKTDGATAGQIRLFDNGDVLVIDGSENVKLLLANGKTKNIEVSSKEQILVGKNMFIYSNKKTVYGYFSEKGKIYRIKGLDGEIDFFNLFGLSSKGAVYYTGENYNFDLLRFGQ